MPHPAYCQLSPTIPARESKSPLFLPTIEEPFLGLFFLLPCNEFARVT